MADTQVGWLSEERSHCLDNRRSVNVCCKTHKATINSLYESDRRQLPPNFTAIKSCLS
ncbi:MAG: hypothetical protein V7K69_14370 [Nostoc sp.]